MTTARTLRRRRRLAVVCCGLVGVLLPGLHAMVQGYPEPHVHDEFSYLLAADTFAHGRLTNHSPRHPQFFEAPHILLEPTYQSKYPVGGPLLMAAGQAIFGHPAIGVWLSSGLFGASLCYLLQSFRFHRWAVPVALFALLVLTRRWGIGHGYWPAMLTGAAAAAVFGSLNVTVKRPSWSATAVLSLGVIGLATTRPFEGLLVCLGCMPLFLNWLFRGRRQNFRLKLQRVLIPGAALLAIAAASLLEYHHAVTGNWRTLPYTLHQRQYFHEGIFFFEPPQQPLRATPFRVSRIYEQFHQMALKELQRGSRGEIGARRLGSAVNLTLSLPEKSRLGLWLTPLILAGFAHRQLRWYAGSIALVFFGMCLTTWHMEWYAMPIIPLLYAALAADVQFIASRVPLRLPSISVPRLIVGGAGLAAVLAAIVLAIKFPQIQDRVMQWRRQAMAGPIPPLKDEGGVTLSSRQHLIELLSRSPGNHLVFVAYDPKYTIHDEWVYNGADLPGAKVLMVHDLGPPENQLLLADYPDRQLWHVQLSPKSKLLTAYSP